MAWGHCHFSYCCGVGLPYTITEQAASFMVVKFFAAGKDSSWA
jgi:hypothetical protein